MVEILSWCNRITSPDDERNATSLYNSLRTKKFVMLIDNMWERVDLTELGVPDPTKDNMYKMVFTLRLEKVCRK